MAELTDKKGVIGNAANLALPNGTIVDKFQQNLGLRLPTGCGSMQDVHLTPSFHFQMKKIDNNHWQLVKP